MKFQSTPSTSHFEVRPGIGYIKLSGFNETTDTELAAALKAFGRHEARRH